LHADRISSRTKKRIQALSAANLAKLDSHNQTTVLSAAAEHGHLAIVQDLMRRGASVNVHDFDGVTPLILACSNGHRRVAHALLEGGASPTTADDDGVTALHVSAQNQELAPIVKALLVRGADPNAQDKDGDTPVHVAAAYNMTTILRLLLHHGGSPNLPNQEGRTPLLEALHQSNEQASAVLLPYSDLAQTSKTKQSALGLALQAGFEDLALRMIQCGCPVSDWAKLEAFATQSKMARLAEHVSMIRNGLGFVPKEATAKDRKRMVMCLQKNKEWLRTKRCAKPCPSGHRTKTLRCKQSQKNLKQPPFA
jgi:ankyrin repeat protein